MGKGRTAWTWPGALVLGVAVIAAGCSSGGSASNSTTTTGASSSTTSGGNTTGTSPGVSTTQINIGAISSKTGQLAGYFDGLAPGMIAYFNTLNANGGINGRHIVLTNNLDDGGSPTQFVQDAHTLIDQDHVFAIGVASAWFTPNYFVTTKTPTYGYNVSANWQGAPNLYAVGGSTQVYANGYSSLAYFIKKVAAKSVAFISYGPAIASSYDACSSYATGMKQAGFNVVLADVGAQLGGSYSSDVQRLQQSGAQLVVTCMQATDNITLARNIQQYGLKIKQFWLNGYDQALLDQYGSLMEGVYVDNVGGVPFQAGDKSRYGNTYPGMHGLPGRHGQVRAQLRLQRSGLPGVAVGGPHRGRREGRRQGSHPGQRHRRHQQDHQLHRRRCLGAGRLGGEPYRHHLARLQCLHTGPKGQVRSGLRPGEAGLRLREQEPQGPGAGHSDAGDTGGLTDEVTVQLRIQAHRLDR